MSDANNTPGPSAEPWHRRVLEHRAGLFAVLTTVAISIGGLAEIIPMYTVPSNLPHVDAIQPYTPLELAGRDIYLREGCYNCHSQMVRPMRAETQRYGEWTRAAELQWDRPFQLGSRRIGPDLQRVGGKYPDSWHWEHMKDPRSTSPGSIMPAYPWLITDKVDPVDVAASVSAMKTLGVPYEDTSVDGVTKAMDGQAAEITGRLAQMKVTAKGDEELVALIAYLQKLGVDGRKVLADGGTL
jgi:cytochrome c oxidase cbb3-type subunit I/II